MARARGRIYPLYHGQRPDAAARQPLEVGVNPHKWDQHVEMLHAVDVYRTRRLVAVHFGKWAQQHAARRVPAQWCSVLETEVSDLEEQLSVQRHEVVRLQSALADMQRTQRVSVSEATTRALSALEQRLQEVEDAALEEERNAFFFFEDEMARLTDELKLARKTVPQTSETPSHEGLWEEVKQLRAELKLHHYCAKSQSSKRTDEVQVVNPDKADKASERRTHAAITPCDMGVQTQVVCAHLCPAMLSWDESLGSDDDGECASKDVEMAVRAIENAMMQLHNEVRHEMSTRQSEVPRGAVDGERKPCREKRRHHRDVPCTKHVQAPCGESLASPHVKDCAIGKGGMATAMTARERCAHEGCNEGCMRFADGPSHGCDLHVDMTRTEKRAVKAQGGQVPVDQTPVGNQTPKDTVSSDDDMKAAEAFATDVLMTLEGKIGAMERAACQETETAFFFFDEELDRLRHEVKSLRHHNSEQEKALALSEKREQELNLIIQELQRKQSCRDDAPSATLKELRVAMDLAKQREKALEREVGDLQCQIHVLASEKDGFKAMAAAEKERRKEAQSKINQMG